MRRIALLLCGLAGGAACAGGPVWTASEGFADVNPNGAWAIGRLDGAAFSVFPFYRDDDLARWDSGLAFPLSYPAAVKNLTDEPIFFGGSIPLQPDEVAIAPGSSAPSVMRWTAPLAGEHAISARFENQDNIGDGFTVVIRIDGLQVFGAALLAAGQTAEYSQAHALGAGSTVDFAVFAHTGDIFGDVSGLVASIERLTPGCPEDIDGDGDVDFADLNRVISAFNTSGAGLEGDVDEDGDVDFADLNRVLGLFNTVC